MITVTLYDQGKEIGKANCVYFDAAIVVESIAPILQQMKDAARKDGVNLTLAAGVRTWDQQLQLRRQNVIDKTKEEDLEYLKNAKSDDFSPKTGKPGWSNHHDGKAYDFNVTGIPKSYEWLVKNAHKFGFIRTVESERWHWEYLPPVKNMFAYIPKTHPTWDGLV